MSRAIVMAILLAHVVGCHAVVDEPKELRLLGMIPMTGTAWQGGSSCLLPVQMAIEDVNAFPGILYGYNLTYEYIDSKVGQRIHIMYNYMF